MVVHGIPADEVTFVLRSDLTLIRKTLDLRADREHVWVVDLTKQGRSKTVSLQLLFGHEREDVQAPQAIVPPTTGGAWELTFDPEIPDRIEFQIQSVDEDDLASGVLVRQETGEFAVVTHRPLPSGSQGSRSTLGAESIKLVSLELPVIDLIITAKLGSSEVTTAFTAYEIESFDGMWVPLLAPPR